MKVRPGRNLMRAVAGVGLLCLIALVAPAIGWTVLAVGVTTCIAFGIHDYFHLARQLRAVAVERKLPTIAGRR